MDALADYGSDSDISNRSSNKSAASSPPSNDSAAETSKSHNPRAPSSSRSEETSPDYARQVRPAHPSSLTAGTSKTVRATWQLQPPELREDKSSLVHCPCDYLAPFQESRSATPGCHPSLSASQRSRLLQKLQSGHSHSSTTTSNGKISSSTTNDQLQYDIYLQNDHEFTNPHHFEASISAWNIRDSMGTTLREDEDIDDAGMSALPL